VSILFYFISETSFYHRRKLHFSL